MTTEEKIKKLLDLAGSPNEHEAKLAMDRARELMAKYCIDLSQSVDIKPNVTSKSYSPPLRLNNANFVYTAMIVNTISKHFGVIPLTHNRSEIKLYGFETNIKLASYAFDAIFNQLNAAFRIGYAKERSITFTEAFWFGAAQSIERKFKITIEVSQALTVYDPVKNLVDKIKSDPMPFNPHAASYSGQLAGKAAGNEASIYKGVHQQTERGNLLQ